MPAFWQALDWCAHHNLWTPAFLEFLGERGEGPTTPHTLLLHLASLASLLPLPGLAGCLAGSLAGGWLATWLAGSLAGGCLAGSLPDWLAG